MSTTEPRPTALTVGKLEVGMPVWIKNARGAWAEPRPIVKIEKQRDGGTTTYTVRRIDGSQKVFTANARLQALPAELGPLTPAPTPAPAPAKRTRRAAVKDAGWSAPAESAAPADEAPAAAPAKRTRKAKPAPAPAAPVTAERAAEVAAELADFHVALTAAMTASAIERGVRPPKPSRPSKVKAAPAAAPVVVTEVRAIPTLTITASYRGGDPDQPLVATVSLTAPTLADAGHWAQRFPATANLKLRSRHELTGPVGVAERVMLLARYDAVGAVTPVPRSVLHLPRIVRHARQLGMTVALDVRGPASYTSLAQLDSALAKLAHLVPGWAQASRTSLAE
jgi:hypothetical protein